MAIPDDAPQPRWTVDLPSFANRLRAVRISDEERGLRLRSGRTLPARRPQVRWFPPSGVGGDLPLLRRRIAEFFASRPSTIENFYHFVLAHPEFTSLAPLRQRLDSLEAYLSRVSIENRSWAPLWTLAGYYDGILSFVLSLFEGLAGLLTLWVRASSEMGLEIERMRTARNRVAAARQAFHSLMNAGARLPDALSTMWDGWVNSFVGPIREIRQALHEGNPFRLQRGVTLLASAVLDAILLAEGVARGLLLGARRAGAALGAAAEAAAPTEARTLARTRAAFSEALEEAAPAEAGLARARSLPEATERASPAAEALSAAEPPPARPTGPAANIGAAVDRFIARFAKLSRDAATRSAVEELFRRSSNAANDVLRRAAAAELDRITSLLRDPDVISVRVIPGRVGGRTPDLAVRYLGAAAETRMEITALTQARKGLRIVGQFPAQTRILVNQLVAAVARKAGGQLASQVAGLAPGGTISVRVMFGGAEIRPMIDQAMSRLARRLTQWPDVERIEWTILGQRPGPSAPLRRTRLVFERQASGAFKRLP